MTTRRIDCRPTHTLSLLVLALTACAAPRAAGPGTQANSPAATPGGRPAIMSEADVKAAMDRENMNLTPTKVASGDWKLEVLSAGPVSIVSQGGLPAVDIPIGAEEPARCILMSADADLMGGVIAGIGSVQEQSKGNVKKVLPFPIGVAQEAPVMFLSAVYGTGTGVSVFTFAVHAHPQHPVMCLHNGLGFGRTFQAAVMHLFETLERGQPTPAPQLVEVWRVAIDGTDRGFTRVTIDKNAEAAWVQDSETALLVPRSATEFASEAASSEELIDSRGRLVRGAWAKAEGKTLVHKVRVSSRDKRGTYDFEGEVGGKPVKGELRSRDKGGIASSVASILRLRDLAAKPAGFDIKQDEYDPGVDPQRLTETRYVRTKTDGQGQLRVITAGRELGAELDPDGRIRDITFKEGASTVHIERIFTRGKL
jgi:hypothetical protein